MNPITADPLVLRFHAPYLVACTIAVAIALLCRRSLGRWMGAALVAAYGLYLGLNLSQMWR